MAWRESIPTFAFKDCDGHRDGIHRQWMQTETLLLRSKGDGYCEQEASHHRAEQHRLGKVTIAGGPGFLAAFAWFAGPSDYSNYLTIRFVLLR
jgi:hypothetical protein